MSSNLEQSNSSFEPGLDASGTFDAVVARMDEDMNVVVSEMDNHSVVVQAATDGVNNMEVDGVTCVNGGVKNGDSSPSSLLSASIWDSLATRLACKWTLLDVQIKRTKASTSYSPFIVLTRRETPSVGLGDLYIVIEERSVLGNQIEVVSKDASKEVTKKSSLFTRFDVELRLVSTNQVVQSETHGDVDELCRDTSLLPAFNDDLINFCKGFNETSGMKLDPMRRCHGCLKVVVKAREEEQESEVCSECLKWLPSLNRNNKGSDDSDVNDDIVAIESDNDGSGVNKSLLGSTISFPLSNAKKEELQARLNELKSSGLITVSPATNAQSDSGALVANTSTSSAPRRPRRNVVKGNSTMSALRSLHGQIETGVIHLEKLPSRSSRLDAESAQYLIDEYRKRKEKAAKRREERRLRESEPAKRVMRKCKICLFQHTNKLTFAKHVEAHEQRFDLKAMVKCPACNIDISKVELNPHYQEHHDKEKVCCIECLLVMTPIELRRNHLDRVHYFTLKTKLCTACGQAFRTDVDLDVHYSVHHDPNAFGGICDHCGHSFKHKKLLEKHISRHHTNTVTGVIRCPFCDQVFEKAYSWHTHIKTHSTSKPYRCRFCDFSSIKRFAVVLHTKKHHFPEATVDDVIGDGSYTFVDKFGQELKKPNIKDYLIKKVDYERMVQQGLLPPAPPADHPGLKEEQI